MFGLLYSSPLQCEVHSVRVLVYNIIRFVQQNYFIVISDFNVRVIHVRQLLNKINNRMYNSSRVQFCFFINVFFLFQLSFIKLVAYYREPFGFFQMLDPFCLTNSTIGLISLQVCVTLGTNLLCDSLTLRWAENRMCTYGRWVAIDPSILENDVHL